MKSFVKIVISSNIFMSKKMPVTYLLLSVIILAATGSGFAQTAENPSKRVNFGYSQNPKTKTKLNAEDNKQSNSEIASKINPQIKIEDDSKQKISVEKPANNSESENLLTDKKTKEVFKRESPSNASPTEIYKIGIGDILFISLRNVSSNSSTYFTVLNDGTIDYPLAGEMVSVVGLTSDEIEDLLKQKIKLFENPQIAVRVREHASHSITVLGLVDKPGEMFLPREAMPLYFVRAEAVIQPKANQATIKHANSGSETIDLNESKNDNVLIFPGDIIEFKYRDDTENNLRQPQFFYIGGNIISGGQKDFYKGLTLTQAILAAGGLRKSSSRKIVIRRKNAAGLLVTTEANLKAMKDGKEPDFLLEAGDTVEVGN